VTELKKVMDFMGQKIDSKFREFTSNFMESMEIEESRQEELAMRVTFLEEKLENAIGIIALLFGLMHSIWDHVNNLEDAVMEESDEDTEGKMVSSSSSSDVEPVKNMVATPAPAPLVVHHPLIPIEIPEEFIPPSLHSTPSPPYIQAQEDDPLHSGVPEYWVDPEISS
jgi:hypothetical protein